MLQLEIRVRQQAEEEIQLLLSTTQGINEASDFDGALEVALHKVCEATGWNYGEAWVATADNTALECSPSWYYSLKGVPESAIAAFEEFREYSQGLTLVPGEELPGRVWDKGRAEWIADLAAEKNDIFLRSQLADQCGIKAGLGVPIKRNATATAEEKIMAVLVFYILESRQEEQRWVQLISAVAAQLGGAIQQKQTEAELRALFSAMTDAIIVLDAQGCYLKIAPTNPTLLYKPARELIGKTLHDVFDRSLADKFISYVWGALNSKETINAEYSLNIQEREVSFAASISPLSDDSVLWVARDITDRKLAEEALREAEEKYRSIFENAAEGIYQTTIEGQYLSANPALARIYGYASPEDLIDSLTNIATQLYVDPNRRSEFMATIEDHEAAFNFESRVYRKDGSIIWISENARAVRSETGKLLLYEGIVEDITQRKEAEEALRGEQQRSESLLLNILPKAIAEELKKNQSASPTLFEDATIMFADLVNFTPLSARMSATDLVNLLNDIFSTFDELAEQHGLEKIKTLGDAYMVAGGLPVPRPDHAEAIAEMALDMQQAIAQFQTDIGESFQIRIGINTGPVVAGVIGIKKFIYDLWGDTVNTASRMESHGIPGTIQLTEDTYQRLQERYVLSKRGEIDIKGKGQMTTYFLTGRKVD
ncbi:MAG: PAS domain S-box protein [Oscillatoria sp. SIO1A7]|nr:PAS domain S-box protein [Oscillatoria sp. SIO1A7]